MKVNFLGIAKIDNEYRLRLYMQTLTSLLKNTDSEDIGSIIIIDDCSEITLPPFKGVTVIRNDNIRGVGYSKNFAYEEQLKLDNDPDYLYFFDTDTFFTKNWLDKLVHCYNCVSERFKILGGGCHPFLLPREGESESVEYFDKNLNTFLINSTDALSGWSWLMYPEIFKKYGKLADNSVGVGKSEDWEYCQRIRNEGFKVGYIDPQIIGHCGLTDSEGKQIVGYEQSLDLLRRVVNEEVIF